MEPASIRTKAKHARRSHNLGTLVLISGGHVQMVSPSSDASGAVPGIDTLERARRLELPHTGLGNTYRYMSVPGPRGIQRQKRHTSGQRGEQSMRRRAPRGRPDLRSELKGAHPWKISGANHNSKASFARPRQFGAREHRVGTPSREEAYGCPLFDLSNNREVHRHGHKEAGSRSRQGPRSAPSSPASGPKIKLPLRMASRIWLAATCKVRGAMT